MRILQLKRSSVRSSALLGLWLVCAACAPQTVNLRSPQAEGLQVTGQGEATAAPDLATIRIGVEERALAPEEAMQRANQTMQRIMDAVKAEGVQPQDLQTADLNMHFERAHDNEPLPVPRPPMSANAANQEQQLAMRERATSAQGSPAKVDDPQPTPPDLPVVRGNYVVRNNIIISLRNLDKVGEVIGAAMSAGANQMYGFELSIEDPSSLQDRAREKAVAAALAKARLLAARTGVSLGPIVAIRDATESRPTPIAAPRLSLERADSSVPFERGQLSVTQFVEVTFSLATGEDSRQESPKTAGAN